MGLASYKLLTSICSQRCGTNPSHLNINNLPSSRASHGSDRIRISTPPLSQKNNSHTQTPLTPSQCHFHHVFAGASSPTPTIDTHPFSAIVAAHPPCSRRSSSFCHSEPIIVARYITVAAPHVPVAVSLPSLWPRHKPCSSLLLDVAYLHMCSSLVLVAVASSSLLSSMSSIHPRSKVKLSDFLNTGEHVDG
ncbi:hypothetical protein PIB30_038369 [Stylosanthes scabra]|uniref:Uncharacterized protein n=1 Tax=Stylosanthes scabra TaxID=79078 RepID=A0ABU6QDF1_9FABA|nr:hypothetical protein [Stylosanthes scabra]